MHREERLALAVAAHVAWARGDAAGLAHAIAALYGAIWHAPDGAPAFRELDARARAAERLSDPARLSALAVVGLWACLDWVGVDRETYEAAVAEALRLAE